MFENAILEYSFQFLLKYADLATNSKIIENSISHHIKEAFENN